MTTNDLKSALSQALPGDTIELKAGTYSSVPYTLKSGVEGKPITIKAAPKANVIFTGSTTTNIFDVFNIKYVNIEGPFELKNANIGIKLTQVQHINVSGLKIHDVQYQGILVTGHYNTIFNNEVYNCVLENKSKAKSRDGGWSQCVAVWGTSGALCQVILFSKIIIYMNLMEKVLIS